MRGYLATSTFTRGAMENAYRLFCVVKVLSLSCCSFWISSNAELTVISADVETTVSLRCRNESLDSLSQLIWTKNTTNLVSFASQTQKIHWYPEAYRLQVNMSLSRADLYALNIDKVQKVHAGNYTCATSTGPGVFEKNWILIVTDKERGKTEKNSLMLIIAISTICVGMIFVICLTILLFRRLKKRNRQPNTAETVNTVYDFNKQDIYENCLEGQHYQSHHIYSN